MSNKYMECITEVYDIRPIDFETGKRIDVPRDDWMDCDECGSKHARVYRLNSGKSVGRNCASKLCCGVTKAMDTAHENFLIRKAASLRARELIASFYDWRPARKQGIRDELFEHLRQSIPAIVYCYASHIIVDAWIEFHKAAGRIQTINGYYTFTE